MSNRYYVLNHEYDRGPRKGDVMVWEGDYWNQQVEPDKLLVRYLWDFGGYYFVTPRDHLVEFVAELELEDIEDGIEYRNQYKRIWNSAGHA